MKAAEEKDKEKQPGKKRTVKLLSENSNHQLSSSPRGSSSKILFQSDGKRLFVMKLRKPSFSGDSVCPSLFL